MKTEIMMKITEWNHADEVQFMRAMKNAGVSHIDTLQMMEKIDKVKDVSKIKFFKNGDKFWMEVGN